MNLLIRALTPDDAVAVEHLYAQSAAHLRAMGDDTDFQFNARIFVRDGFGENPAFRGIGAELDGRLVGYLLYSFEYDTDRATRYLYVNDLAVDEALRRRGVGRALMARAGVLCGEAGGHDLVWAVYENNEMALRFYRSLGAEDVRGLRFMRMRAGG